MARAGASRTELASQSEAARATRLFATEQSGINGMRLYSEAVQENRGNTGGIQGYVQEEGDVLQKEDILQACIYRGLKPSYSTLSISLSLQSIDTSKH